MARTKEEIAAYARAWRARNRDRINAAQNARNATPEGRAKQRARNQAFYAKASAEWKRAGFAKLQAWVEANPQRAKEARRKQYRRRCSGVHPDDATGEMREGPCEICRASTKLHFDHDHQTGRFRGWLCRSCNCGLGHFKDDPSRLIAAVAYLACAKERQLA